MLPVRRSPDPESNKAFEEDRPRKGETNLAWIQRGRAADPAFFGAGDVILLGGSSLSDFRIRIAQSHARHDLTPSYWSLAGILDANDLVLTAPLWPLLAPDRVPLSNGIQAIPLSKFDSPRAWPNVAVVRFPGVQMDPVDAVTRLREQRSIIDIPTLILPWLGFVWGAGSVGNPLLNGFGVPSAVLVETAFGMAEVELTPGLAAASSCPEAIYQAAKWWSGYYENTAGLQTTDEHPPGPTVEEPPIAPPINPVGCYLLRQRQATYVEPKPIE
jgi:hypothetical protein